MIQQEGRISPGSLRDEKMVHAVTAVHRTDDAEAQPDEPGCYCEGVNQQEDPLYAVSRQAARCFFSDQVQWVGV